MVGNRKVGAAHGKFYTLAIMADSSKNGTIGGTPRAATRPAHVKAPATWSNTPIPSPQPAHEDKPEDQPGGRNPVRYGDWELKGVAVDF